MNHEGTVPVDQGSIRSPAEWIAMRELGVDDQTSSALQVFDDALVCRFDMLSLVVADDGCEAARIIDGIWWWPCVANNTMCKRDSVIVLSVGWCLVNDYHTLLL